MHHVQCAGARHYVMNRGGGNTSDKPGVFKNFFNNVRQGLEKNKEMQVLLKGQHYCPTILPSYSKAFRSYKKKLLDWVNHKCYLPYELECWACV